MNRVERFIESLSSNVKSYRIKRKLERAYDPDIDANQLAKYLIMRVEQSTKESLEVSSTSFESTGRALRYLRNMVPVALSSLTENEMEQAIVQYGQPLIRVYESLNLLDDALLLAMAGRYTSSLTILRSALESMIVGGFYHGLANSDLRNKASELLGRRRRWPWSMLELIANLTNSYENVSGISLESMIENELVNQDPPLTPPTLRFMLDVVIHMYEPTILPNPLQQIHEELYENLSVYAHVMSDGMTIVQHGLDEEPEFDSGKVSLDLIHKFQGYFIGTLDMVGALYYTFTSDLHASPRVRQLIIQQDSQVHMHREGLDLTFDALRSAIGLRRV